MQERVQLQDLTTLIICPSKRWSTLERRALLDSVFFRDIGGNATILCYKGSQLDKEADSEDINRLYMISKKFKILNYINFALTLRKIKKENRFDVIHCFDLNSMWVTAFIMKRDVKVPLFFTFNQNLEMIYRNRVRRWLLKRVDRVFAMSSEIKAAVCESFYVSNIKVKDIGCGLDLIATDKVRMKEFKLGCIVDNINELKRLRYVLTIFKHLKRFGKQGGDKLMFSVFLGPRIYQRPEAKKVLTELDHEFYEGDIMLFSLEKKKAELKNLDLFCSVAFDEPLNDYEISSLVHRIPVLLPRTAARQNLLFNFPGVGESYYEGDIREARKKIEKILNSYDLYLAALNRCSEQLQEVHGIDSYADIFKQTYELAVAKRYRLNKPRKAK